MADEDQLMPELPPEEGDVLQNLAQAVDHLSASIGDQGLAHRTLSQQINTLTSTISTQGVAQVINPYGGDPKSFREWLKCVEKYAMLIHADVEKLKLIAYQSSKGAVSDYLKRYLNDNPRATWAQCKTQLTFRFAEVTDPQHAFSLLRHVRQKQGETVQVFSERLTSLVEEAYLGQPRGVEAVERQIVGFFVDGLSADYLKMKILRQNPATLEAAVTVAMEEQNLRTRFDLRLNSGNATKVLKEEEFGRGHEPMEIGHYRSKNTCFKCNQKGHIAKYCRVKIPDTQRGNSVHRPMSDVVCYFCSQKGHFQSECPDRNPRRPLN